MDEKTIKSDPTSLDSVKSVVDSVVAKHAKSINDLVKEISSIQSLTEEQIQDYLLKMQIESFYLADSVSDACFRQEFTNLNGKDTNYTKFASNTNESMDMSRLAPIVYNTIANKLNSKLDETHRMIQVLKVLLESKRGAPT